MDALTAVAGSTAEPHRVWCVELDDIDGSATHRHVVALATSGADGRRSRWTIVQVIAAIREGELFVVGEGGRGQAAVLEPWICPHCRRATVITHPSGALERVDECVPVRSAAS